MANSSIKIAEREVITNWIWDGLHYPPVKGQPPLEYLDAQKWAHFPQVEGKRTFQVTKRTGKTHKITIADHTLHVLLGVMQRPVCCASRARISQYVSRLNKVHDVQIETVMYDNYAWGLYFLIDKVEMIAGCAE